MTVTGDQPNLQPDPMPPLVSAAPAEITSSGLSPTAAATLACLGGWVTGLLFLLTERDSRFVRFHAAQAVVGVGGFWLAGVLCWGVSFLAVFFSVVAFRVLMIAAQVLWIVALFVWMVCLYKAYRGERWLLPYAGTIAERLAFGDRSATHMEPESGGPSDQ